MNPKNALTICIKLCRHEYCAVSNSHPNAANTWEQSSSPALVPSNASYRGIPGLALILILISLAPGESVLGVLAASSLGTSLMDVQSHSGPCPAVRPRQSDGNCTAPLCGVLAVFSRRIVNDLLFKRAVSKAASVAFDYLTKVPSVPLTWMGLRSAISCPGPSFEALLDDDDRRFAKSVSDVGCDVKRDYQMPAL